jgi:hypothetical protein
MARRSRSPRLLLLLAGVVAASLVSSSVPVSAAGTQPLLHLRRFSSPDHKVSCEILDHEEGGPAVGCNSFDDGFHSGYIDSSEVGVCNHPPGAIYCSAVGGRSGAVPAGGTVEAEGFRCISERGGIACIQTSGRLAGRGFWVDRNRAVKIRRPVPRKGPPATPPGGSGGPSHPQLWSALEKKVTCGIGVHEASPARTLVCNASPIPAPIGVDPSLGGPGWVYLEATGLPETYLNSQVAWQVGLIEPHVRIPELATGTTWRFGPLGIACSMSAESVTCTNRAGHGFTVTAESYSAF